MPGRPAIAALRDPSRLALIIALALLVEPTRPTTAVLAFAAAVVVLLVVGIRRPVPRATLLVLLVGALAIRFAIRTRVGSDVLDVTAAAIDRILLGLSPYGVGYEVSRPPGAPYPYGPLALFWYLPVADLPRLAELLSATVVATVLALQGRFVGLALYATMPAIVSTSVDGSNDTTLGLLLLVTFLLAPRRPMLAAVALAGAVAFKVSAAAWVPALLLWGGWRFATAFGVTSMALWSPVVFLWGPAAFVSSLVRAAQLHVDMVWSLGAVLRGFLDDALVRALDSLRVVLGAGVAIATLRFARSLDGAIVAGTLVYLVTLFGGTWASYSYLAALAPLLCLRIDDWLGLPTLPAGQPGDEGPAEPRPDAQASEPTGAARGA